MMAEIGIRPETRMKTITMIKPMVIRELRTIKWYSLPLQTTEHQNGEHSSLPRLLLTPRPQKNRLHERQFRDLSHSYSSKAHNNHRSWDRPRSLDRCYYRCKKSQNSTRNWNRPKWDCQWDRCHHCRWRKCLCWDRVKGTCTKKTSPTMKMFCQIFIVSRLHQVISLQAFLAHYHQHRTSNTSLFTTYISWYVRIGSLTK